VHSLDVSFSISKVGWCTVFILVTNLQKESMNRMRLFFLMCGLWNVLFFSKVFAEECEQVDMVALCSRKYVLPPLWRGMDFDTTITDTCGKVGLDSFRWNFLNKTRLCNRSWFEVHSGLYINSQYPLCNTPTSIGRTDCSYAIGFFIRFGPR
jgi:hypothetical protein